MDRYQAGKSYRSIAVILAALALTVGVAQASDEPDPGENVIVDNRPMTAERLGNLITNVDDEAVLDARYAVAQGMLWGTYIHPLSTLTDEEFLVGLGQTANVVLSYGTSYSSGVFMFNGGDSAEIEQQRLIEELKKRKT